MKDQGKKAQKGNTPARRLLLKRETIRNLLTPEQLKYVHGGLAKENATDGDGNSSRNNRSC